MTAGNDRSELEHIPNFVFEHAEEDTVRLELFRQNVSL